MGIKVICTEGLYREERSALKEYSDCVVRAIASAYNCDYNTAHTYARDYLGRKRRQGVLFPEKFTGKDGVSKHAEAIVFDKPHTKRVTMPFTNEVGHKDSKCYGMHLSKFVKNYPKGTYLILSSGHAYTIKDGVLYGNYRDDKTYVKVAYKINKTL